MRVLIAGIAGRTAQIVAKKLSDAGHSVAGVDQRPWEGKPDAIEHHKVDLRKRAAEDVFRKFRPEAVVHMATVTHLLGRRSEDQYRINLGATRAVFDNAAACGTQSVVFVGRHTFYGAAADAALYHTEDEPPVEVTAFPELADLVAADLYAGTALWRMPQVDTCVLRMCYSLGAARHGTLAAFLSNSRVPGVFGFDPLFQFMHEEDHADTIVLALEKRLRGVFNVAGPQPVPLSVIARTTGRSFVPVPEVLFRAVLGRFGLPSLPPAALNHIKYPVVIDAAAFRKATGFAYKHSEEATMRAFREAFPPPIAR